MGKVQWTISITTAVVLIYVITSTLSSSFAIVFGLLLVSQILLIRMVLVILKDKNTSTKTFDEFYYEDVDIKVNKSL